MILKDKHKKDQIIKTNLLNFYDSNPNRIAFIIATTSKGRNYNSVDEMDFLKLFMTVFSK